MTCYTADFAGTLTADQEIEELRWIGSSCPAVKDTAASAALSLACHCLSTIFPPHFLALALPLRPPLPWQPLPFHSVSTDSCRFLAFPLRSWRRHCCCLVIPLTSRLQRHCRFLASPLRWWRSHCRCLAFPLPSWLSHSHSLVCVPLRWWLRPLLLPSFCFQLPSWLRHRLCAPATKPCPRLLRGAAGGASWLTAAIPIENPYCSCKQIRVRGPSGRSVCDRPDDPRRPPGKGPDHLREAVRSRRSSCCQYSTVAIVLFLLLLLVAVVLVLVVLVVLVVVLIHHVVVVVVVVFDQLSGDWRSTTTRGD